MTPARSLSAVLDDRAALAGFSRLSLSMVLTNPQAPDNPIVYVNDAFERITGYSRSSVVGRNCRFLQGERTQKADVDKIRTAVEAGRDVTVDILNYRSSGEPFTNRLIIAPILGENGAPLYYLGLQKEIRDGEESALADQQLVALRSRVREDLSLVLATISEPSRHESVDDPMHEVEALPRRLDCLQLVYEEMKLTDTQAARYGIDLGSLISRVAANVAHSASRPGLRFSLIVDPCTVDLDTAVRTALILSETLSNAFEHAFDGLDEGCIELRAMALAAGGLRLLISDDGVGIPAKIDWPSPATVGGRLIGALLDGLDATINVARGAAGTIVMIDIPASFDASKPKGD